MENGKELLKALLVNYLIEIPIALTKTSLSNLVVAENQETCRVKIIEKDFSCNISFGTPFFSRSMEI